MGENRKSSSSDRLEKLEDRLKDAQSTVDERTRPRERQPNAIGFAFRITTELVAALAVGVAIGWGLDNWLDTKPWFLILFFFLGIAAGVSNVYRVTKSSGGNGSVPRSKLPSVPDDDDD